MRRDVALTLWREWSPSWDVTDEEFLRTAPSFDNPDFVDVVVHSYRHRYGLVEGDPQYDGIERTLAGRPRILVPTAVVEGTRKTLAEPQPLIEHERHFEDLRDYRTAPVGHDFPQEAPAVFAAAVLAVHSALER